MFMPHNEKLFDFFLIKFPSSSFVLFGACDRRHENELDENLLGLEIQRFPLMSQSI